MSQTESHTTSIPSSRPAVPTIREAERHVCTAFGNAFTALAQEREGPLATLAEPFAPLETYETETGVLRYCYNRIAEAAIGIEWKQGTRRLNITNKGITIGSTIHSPIYVRLTDRGELFRNLLSRLETHWQRITDTPLPAELHGEVSEAIAAYDHALDAARENITKGDLKTAVNRQDADLLTFLLGEDEHIADQSNTEAAGLFEQDRLHVTETQSYILAIPIPDPDDVREELNRVQPDWRTSPRTLDLREQAAEVLRETNPDEGFVLGLDDTPTGTFVHAVDVTNYETSNTVTDEKIRAAMGFENDADHDYTDFEAEYESPPQHAPIRVQGDLAFEALHSFAEIPATINSVDDEASSPLNWRQRGTSRHHAIDATLYAAAFADHLRQSCHPRRVAARFLNSVDVYLDHSNEPCVRLNPSFYDLANQWLNLERETSRMRTGVRGLRTREPGSANSLGRRDILPDARRFLRNSAREDRLQSEVEGTLEELIREMGNVEFRTDLSLPSFWTTNLRLPFTDMDNPFWDKTVDDARQYLRDQQGQMNLPIDNHLLLFESAWRYPLSSRESEPVLVVVPEESTVSILHDEHDTKTFTLSPGLYRFHLLDRGVKPLDDLRPDW